MPFRRPSELTDEEVRGAIAHLLLEQQELTVILAQTALITLFNAGQMLDPTDEELADTVASLRDFLERTRLRLQQINDTTEYLKADLYSQN